MREKPRGVGDVARERAMMKTVEEVQGRVLYSGKVLEGYLRERYRVERDRK